MVFVNLLNDRNRYSAVLAMRIPLVSPLMLLLDVERISKWSMPFDSSACIEIDSILVAHTLIAYTGEENTWYFAKTKETWYKVLVLYEFQCDFSHLPIMTK